MFPLCKLLKLTVLSVHFKHKIQPNKSTCFVQRRFIRSQYDSDPFFYCISCMFGKSLMKPKWKKKYHCNPSWGQFKETMKIVHFCPKFFQTFFLTVEFSCFFYQYHSVLLYLWSVFSSAWFQHFLLLQAACWLISDQKPLLFFHCRESPGHRPPLITHVSMQGTKVTVTFEIGPKNSICM